MDQEFTVCRGVGKIEAVTEEPMSAVMGTHHMHPGRAHKSNLGRY